MTYPDVQWDGDRCYNTMSTYPISVTVYPITLDCERARWASADWIIYDAGGEPRAAFRTRQNARRWAAAFVTQEPAITLPRLAEVPEVAW